mmetsp:Transcript_79237/g.119113  ORF Transcript_79237/g.119113 Transcript_79237/m.119113 type:complete len:83 (-) Transcript_79237:182-430(-)
MEQLLRDNMLILKNKEEESFPFVKMMKKIRIVKSFMKDNLKKIYLMVMDIINGKMEDHTKETGKTEKCMARVNLNGEMEEFM